MATMPDTAAMPDPGTPGPIEVPAGAPIEAPQPAPDVIDPAIGIPTGPSPAPTNPRASGAPLSPGPA